MGNDDDREISIHKDPKPDDGDSDDSAEHNAHFDDFLRAMLTTPVKSLPPIPKMPTSEEEINDKK